MKGFLIIDDLQETQHQTGHYRCASPSNGKSHVREKTDNDVDRSIPYADAVDADGTSPGDEKDLVKFLQELQYCMFAITFSIIF
jgi:hypothetical protein